MRDYANKQYLKDKPATRLADYLTIAAIAAAYFLTIILLES